MNCHSERSEESSSVIASEAKQSHHSCGSRNPLAQTILSVLNFPLQSRGDTRTFPYIIASLPTSDETISGGATLLSLHKNRHSERSEDASFAHSLTRSLAHLLSFSLASLLPFLLTLLLLPISGCKKPATKPFQGNVQNRPTAPTDLRSRSVTHNKVILSWIDNSDNEQGFHVYMSVGDDSSYREIAGLPPDTVEFEVEEVSFKRELFFAVAAFNDFGESKWDSVAAARGGVLVNTIGGQDSPALDIVFSPNGKLLLSGWGDYGIRLYNYMVPNQVAEFQIHGNVIEEIAYSPDSSRFASRTDRGNVKVWNFPDNDVEYEFHDVDAVAFHPYRSVIALSMDYLLLWDLELGIVADTLSGGVMNMAFTPDGRYLVGSGGGYFTIWDPDRSRSPVMHELSNIGRFTLSNSGRYIASTSRDTTVQVYKIVHDVPMYLSHVRTFTGPTRGIHDAAISPDDGLLAAGSDDWKTYIWDFASGELLATLTDHGYSVYSVAFSPEGEFLATGSGDTKIMIWSVIF